MAMLDAARPQCHPATRKPLYAQVREQLLARIRNCEWGAGESLPNEFILSSDFEVSIGTIRRAVADLEASGVLVRKQGRGTFVAGQGAAALEERFCALRTPLGERLNARYELISLARRAAAASELAALGGVGAANVVEIVQQIVAQGQAIGIERSVLPSARFPRIETQLQFGQHLYPLLADYGQLVTRVEDTIGIEPAGPQHVPHLPSTPGQPLLAVKRIAFALDGAPVEVRCASYLPEHVCYTGAARAL